MNKLTQSEHDILVMVVAGMSNKEIATVRRTKTQTVKNQTSVMYEKLGVRSRSEAAVRAIVLGLVGGGKD